MYKLLDFHFVPIMLAAKIAFFILCLCCIENGTAEDQSSTCDNILDLIIVLDSSGSIQPVDFSKAIQAMQTFVSLLKIGPKKVMVTVINYSTNVQVPITFADMKVTNFSVQWLINKIGTIDHLRANTHTHQALIEAKNICGATCRPFEEGVARSVVVFTDGRSTQPAETIKEAANLRSTTHANIFAVGIGGYYLPELQAIASDPTYVFTMQTYQELTVLINEITNQTCQMPAFVQLNVQVDTEVPADTYRYYRLDINLLRRSEGGFFELTVSLQTIVGNEKIVRFP